MKRLRLSFAFWLGTILFWELTLHLAVFRSLTRGLPMVGFSVAAAALVCLLTALPRWPGKLFSWILPPVLYLVYAVQLVYEEIFGSLLSVAFVSMGGEAITAFWSILIAALWKRLWLLLLMALPLAAFYVLRAKKRFPTAESWMDLGVVLVVAVVAAVGTWAVLPQFGPGINDPAALFRNPTATVDRRSFSGRADFEKALAACIDGAGAQLIILAGFMCILSEEFTRRYDGRIINVHPSLIPSFCGEGFYGLHVHEAALARGVKLTGATVHFVNEIPDGGRIIMQKALVWAITRHDTHTTTIWIHKACMPCSTHKASMCLWDTHNKAQGLKISSFS